VVKNTSVTEGVTNKEEKSNPRKKRINFNKLQQSTRNTKNCWGEEKEENLGALFSGGDRVFTIGEKKGSDLIQGKEKKGKSYEILSGRAFPFAWIVFARKDN